MKPKWHFIIIIFETLVICVFVFEKLISTGDFVFLKNKNAPFPHTFDFFFLESKDTYGSISVDDDGNYESIFLRDKSGRLITFGFDRGHIVSYVIKDEKDNYEMTTYFLLDSLRKKNNTILVRGEKFNSKKHQYFLDYNLPPFFFFESPTELGEFEIDPYPSN